MKSYFKKKKERKKKKQMERELRRKKQFQYNQDKKSNPKILKGTKNPFNNFHNNPKVNNETFGCQVCNDLLSTNQKKILEKIPDPMDTGSRPSKNQRGDVSVISLFLTGSVVVLRRVIP